MSTNTAHDFCVNRLMDSRYVCELMDKTIIAAIIDNKYTFELNHA